MSTSDDYHERRLTILQGRVEPEYLEGLQGEPTDTDETDPMVDALSHYGEECLSDRDAIEREIEQLERKLSAVGDAVTDDRRTTLETRRDALQQALEVSNSFLDNSPEALAERINQ